MYKLIAIFSSGTISPCGEATLTEIKEFINKGRYGATIFVIKQIENETN